MQYPHGTTIAVTDGRRLRLFRNNGDDFHLRLVELAAPEITGHNQGGGRRHHTGGDNPDHGQLEEDSHAAAAADWLNSQVLAGAIEKLFIVAPPRTLGELRRHYHGQLRERLLGELGKEHTHDSVDFLHDALLKA
ncbi:MAG: hypothetical protein RL026_2514 [Pseudomonadota bacterium]|jgi:protein required for attachment to host cells